MACLHVIIIEKQKSVRVKRFFQMTEKELILKIRKLKNIQPDQKWVVATRSQILGQAGPSFTFAWLKNRAFLVAPALVFLLIVGVFLASRGDIAIFRLPGNDQAGSVDPVVIEVVTTGLRTFGLDVARATVDLQKTKDPQKVLGVKDSVSNTLENGEKIVAAAKKLSEKPASQEFPEVLTVISGVESALEEMEKTYVEKQKEMASQLIEDLESGILQESQQELVRQAKEFYNNGNFSEALIKAIEAFQLR